MYLGVGTVFRFRSPQGVLEHIHCGDSVAVEDWGRKEITVFRIHEGGQREPAQVLEEESDGREDQDEQF